MCINDKMKLDILIFNVVRKVLYWHLEVKHPGNVGYVTWDHSMDEYVYLQVRNSKRVLSHFRFLEKVVEYR